MMVSKKTFNLSGKSALAAVATWLALWILPWQNQVENAPLIATMIAISLFALPGVFLYLIFRKNPIDLIELTIFGFAFSMLLFYLIGLAGRIVGFSFDQAVTGFFIVGTCSIIFFFSVNHKRQPVQILTKKIPLAFILIIFVSVSVSFMKGAWISSDDPSYLANITKWQYAAPLNFNEVIFGTGFEGSTRYTIALFPIIISFISHVSNVHGLLLITVFLRIVFITMSLLSLNLLYSYLMKSESKAMQAVALQVLMLSLLNVGNQPGKYFFQRIVEDKSFAAYFVAPLFFILLLRYLEKRSTRRLLLFALITATLSITHPVTLAFCAMVAGLYSVFDLFLFRRPKPILFVLLILLLSVLPHAALMLSDHPSNTLIDGGRNLTKNTYLENEVFFGFNLRLLKTMSLCSTAIICENLYLFIVAFGFYWSIIEFRKKIAARYTLASFIVVALCYVPYTGWLIAKFVSYRMLFRSPWIFPIGFSTWLLVDKFLSFAKPFSSRIKNNTLIKLSSPTYILLIISAVIFLPNWNFPSIQRHERLYATFSTHAEIGKYLENLLPTPTVIVGSKDINNLIPGLASNAIPFVHRPRRGAVLATFAYFYSKENLQSRRNDFNILESPKEKNNFEIKKAILDKYKVQYLLLNENKVGINQFLNQSEINLVEVFDHFYLLEYVSP